MPIRTAGKRFNNELRPTQDLPYLKGCIGEKIAVEIDFYYENVLISNAEDVIIGFAPQANFAGDTLDSSSMILIQGSTFFESCNVGDLIEVNDLSDPSYPNNGIYTIKEILDGTRARMTVDFIPYGAGVNWDAGYFGGASGGDTGYIANVTALKGARYSFNLVEAGIDYTSLIDGETQRAETNLADASDTVTEVDMPLGGITSYHYGSVSIVGGGIANAQQKFTIKHEWAIVPFFLSNQLDDLRKGKKPTYLEAANCLNYISKIDIGKELDDPNGLTTVQVDAPKSNTGWFNENFNGKPNKYYIDSLEFTRLSDVETVDYLELDEDIRVVATIKNPDPSFFDTTSKCVFGFNYLPEVPDLYQDNGYDLKRNFLFDSKMASEGVTVNGDNFGNAMQVIKTVRLERISANEATVTAVIEFGSDAAEIMRQGDFKNYMLWVIVENPTLTAENSDKVNLLLQVAEIYEQLTTVDLIDTDTVFIEHPYTDRSFGQATLEMFPVDDVASDTSFSIDFTGLEADGISIQTIRPKVVARKSGSSDVVLDSYSINVANSPLIGTLPSVQNIDFSQDRVFKREDGIFKTITVKRDFDSDTGLEKFWSINYPFMNRWEYWIALQNLALVPSDLFDPTLTNNGINHLWNRIANVTGWELYYVLEFEILQNGELFAQEFDYGLTSQDFETNTDWTNLSLKSYDPDTNDELTNGGNAYLLGYKNTKIVASFEKTTGAVPDVSQVAMALWIEPYEGLGTSDIRLISSEYNLISASWFRNLSTNKLSLSQAGSVFTGTCEVDYSKLPQNKKFTIYARIYEKNGVVATYFRITNLDEIRELMNGDLRIYL